MADRGHLATKTRASPAPKSLAGRRIADALDTGMREGVLICEVITNGPAARARPS
ncbi:hypothetical protein GCM10010201_36210 [Pilimelia columellifera subsp. columellifera]|uniref:Uncharacterized protein n=1 Tax=Pilimelia columellifera subsp. columellifera TaxID=706583 RepID=A0ABN3NUP7_9ACTN